MDYFRQPIKPPDDLTDHNKPEVAYRVGILWNRAIIGVLGILLPLVFIIGEAYFLKGGVHVRGSISAYYHSSMRDTFIAGLCIIGFFLATYLSGEGKTLDFALSLVAGLAVLGVAFAVLHRRLRAFLVVHDEVDGEAKQKADSDKPEPDACVGQDC